MFQGIFKSAINEANKNYIFGTGSIPIQIKTAQLATFADGTTKQQGYQVAEVNKLISTMLTGWDANGNKPKSMSDNYLELILSCDNGFVVKKRLQFPHIIAWQNDNTPYNIADVYKEFSIDNWLKADDFENPDITLVVEPTDEILTTSTANPPEATTTNSGRFYLYYRNLPVGVNRIHIDFNIKTKTEPIDFDLEVIDGLSWKDAQTILASDEQAKINILLSTAKDVYNFTGAEGNFDEITMHEWNALYQQIISLNPNNKFTHDLYFYLYEESELNTKLTELEDELNQIDTIVNGDTTIEEITITADQAGFINLSDGTITNPSSSWKHTILIPIDSFVSATGFINHNSVAGIALYSSDSFDSYLGGFTGLNTGIVITDLSPYTSQYPTARYVAFSTDTSKLTFVCKYNNTVEVNGLKNRVELLEGDISIINEDVNGLKSKVSSLRKISASNKMLHISFDDTINAFKDLIDNNRASLFGSPFFSTLKTLHDAYGCVFSCYYFYDMIDLKYVSKITTISSPSTTSVYYLSKTDESYSAGLYVYRNSTWTAYDNSTMRDDYILFSLSDMTNTYATELSSISDWLKFGFHWIDGLEGLSGITRTSEEVKTAYDNAILDIVRITGTVKSIDMVPRLQGFGGDINICRALRDCDCGCLGFLTSDYSETSGGQGGQSQGYYLTAPAPVVLWNKGQWYDYQERLHFYPSSLRLDGQTATATETYMNKFMSVSKWGQAEMICMYCHENQMFTNGGIASNYIAALTKVAEWAIQHDYLFGYPMDKIRMSL